MDILEIKILKKEVHKVEISGVESKFHGNTAGIISNGNKREWNVVIAYDLKKIKSEYCVFPTVVNEETAKKLYNGLE